MADADAPADYRGEPGVGMDDGPVLDVGVIPDRDPLRVAPKDGEGPYGDAVTQRDAAASEGEGMDVGGQRAEGRGQRAESRGQRAEGRGQRAEGRGQRAEGRGQRAEAKRAELRG
jgi:hypothetical protein